MENLIVFRKKKEDGSVRETSLKAASNQLRFSYKDQDTEQMLKNGDKLETKNYEYSIDSSQLNLNIQKKDPIVPEVVDEEEFMSDKDQKKLEKWEKQVANSDMTMFEAAVKRGKALHNIKESGLYKKKRIGSDIPAFKTFTEYVKYQYNKGRTMGRNYISLYKVAELLESQGVEPKLLGTVSSGVEIYDEIGKIVRKLEVGNDEADEVTRKLVKLGWTLISRSVPKDGDGKPDLSPSNIHLVFDTLAAVAKNGTVELDGKEIPVSLAETIFDAQLIEAIYERMQTRKDAIVRDKDKSNKRKKEPKDEDFVVLDIDEKDKIMELECPEHGTVQPTALILAGFVMTCGHNACFKALEDGSNVFVID